MVIGEHSANINRYMFMQKIMEVFHLAAKELSNFGD
ncbi:hypothetical protein SAMN05421676_10628 [Salinibacillus kushneri]|uniref:Uncharacterized protein n=1 Tax=Salinibacillus kushneri TaxID=237682 RepID=A0A1I0FQN8_9BACI|nr:hypothetical protein SAMN05421676_10628 [Salinibacillus kushneri]